MNTQTLKGRLYQKKCQRVHQSQLFSGYNQKSISEIIVIVRIGRITWASLNIFLLIKARFQKNEILSKKSSSDISFNYILHTRNVEPHLISHHLVCCSCPV